jgi:cystathionine beta-lyase
MFVAEMDFPLAPEIKAALQEAIEAGDTGYVNPLDNRAAAAFADFASDAWGWSPRVERMGVTTDVSVVVVEALRRLIPPGGGVIITPPVYPPFFAFVHRRGSSAARRRGGVRA